MAIRSIIEVPDPRLKVISTSIDTIDDATQTLINDMFETMYDAPGIGLAAVQVGMPRRLLVIDLQERDEETDATVRNPMVFINPEILEVSEELASYNEGCLSVPEQYADVDRPAVIKARWQDREGQVHEKRIDGMLATCLQHEMDHLEGILFIDYLSKLKRDMVLKKLQKAKKLAA